MGAHEFQEDGRCVYCSSTAEMITKHGWGCVESRVPLDRVINRKIYAKVEQEKRIAALRDSPDPWDRIIFTVYHSSSGFAGLSRREQQFYVLSGLAGEISNGGIEQYFGNSSGDHVGQSIQELSLIGLLDCADSLRTLALSAFGSLGKAASLADRHQIMYRSELLAPNFWESGLAKMIEAAEPLISDALETLRQGLVDDARG